MEGEHQASIRRASGERNLSYDRNKESELSYVDQFIKRVRSVSDDIKESDITDDRLFSNRKLYVEGRHRPYCRGWVHAIASFITPCWFIAMLTYSNTLSEIASSIIFSLSSFFCYTVSALYHLNTWNANTEIILQKIDHAGILIMTAGSYSPLALIILPPNLCIYLLISSWLLCILGSYKIFISKPSIIYNILTAATLLPCMPYIYYNIELYLVYMIFAVWTLYIIGMIIFKTHWPNPYHTICGYHEIFHIVVFIAGCITFIIHYNIVKTTISSPNDNLPSTTYEIISNTFNNIIYMIYHIQTHFNFYPLFTLLNISIYILLYNVLSYVYNFQDKQRSYIISLFLSSSSVITYILYITNFISIEPWMILHNMVCGFICDLVGGYFLYPSHMAILDGYIHHIFYIVFFTYIISSSSTEHEYMSLFILEEIPTILMGIKAIFNMHPPHYYALFMTSFIQFRILYHIYVIYTIPTDILFIKGWLYPIVLSIVTCLHLYWISKMIGKSRHTSSLWLTLPAFILNTHIHPISLAILILLPYVSYVYHDANYNGRPYEWEFVIDRCVILALKLWAVSKNVYTVIITLTTYHILSFRLQEHIKKIIFVSVILKTLYDIELYLKAVVVIGCVLMYIGFFEGKAVWSEKARHMWHIGVTLYLVGGYPLLCRDTSSRTDDVESE